MKKYDFVIPLKTDESIWGDNNELRYLLRSVEKYFPVKNVIIIADKLPDWVNPDEVILICAYDMFKHNKDANIINKVFLAAADENITPTFFWSCDDHLILRKPLIPELKPMFMTDLKNEQSWWWSGQWKQGMARTKQLLEKNNNYTYHYDAHIPQPVEASRFVELFKDFEMEEEVRYCINTLFFNQASLKKHHQIGILKATFEKPVTEKNEIETSCYNRLYISYNNKGLTLQLQQFIVNTFPNPSKYEL
ncbi:MAG: hypothetical protein QM504_11015 [Pseudomonadota bacterium]